jgi:uncharacterized protein
MILVDANLLLYAENKADPNHARARDWWQEQLSGAELVCLAWVVVSAFIRIGTSHRAFPRPLSLAQATGRVQEWLDRPNVRVINPTRDHWQTFRSLLEDGQAAANLVTDAHLAALAVEHGCELCSADADFARFPRLKWRNPLDP